MRRRRNERGAVLVELAMCVPLLIVLSLGIIDYGHAFTDKITLKGGVREAVWNGSRQVWGSAVNCGLVGVTASGDAAADANTKRIMCMAKTRTQLPASEIRSKVIFYDIGNPSASVPYGPGAGLMVCTMRMGKSVTGFFSFTIDNTVQRAKLGTVIIKADTPGMSALAESPLPGQSWSFCDASAAAST